MKFLAQSITVFIIFILTINLNAQDTGSAIVSGAPNLYIKCWQCDMTRLKREIGFVNYVIQRQDADIVVLVTDQSTGNGSKYSIYFEGQGDNMNNLKDTMKIDVLNTDSESVIDDRLIATIKKGLLPYLINSPIGNKITYSIKIETQKKEEKIDDPWNSWVFSVSGRGRFSGQSSYDRVSFYSSLNAKRITEKSILSFYGSNNIVKRNYYVRDSLFNKIDSLTVSTERTSKYFSGKYIHSLNNHWSAGAFLSANSDTYSNFDLGLSLRLGVEYNLFDFKKSDRKSLVFSYKIGGLYNDYVDTTIYNKLEESLLQQSISLSLFQKQKWGDINLGASFSNYMHDIRINNLSFNGSVSWNVFKGVNLNIGGYLSFVNDQISLQKQGVDIIDKVLGDRLLSTDYTAFSWVGLSYTFGSKYANAVNPRFSSGNTYYFY